MGKNRLAKAASLIMILTVVSKVLGFVRDSLTASRFGATLQTDAYNMSLTVPNVLFNLFGLAITTTFIPLLSESFSKKGKKDMFDFANSVINILLLVSLFLCVVGWIGSPAIVKLIAPKFTGEKYNLTVYLTRYSILNVLFLSMTSCYMALLQSLNEFSAPTLTGVMQNLPIILYLVIGVHHGIIGLTIITVIGYGLQIFIQIPWLVKHGYKYTFKINFRDERLKRMMYLIMPVLIGIGVNQINTIVDKNMASGLPDGSVSALDYGNRISTIVYYIFASTIVMVIYPTLSKKISDNNMEDFKSYVAKAINVTNLLMIPSALATMILRVPLINIAFKHGHFDAKAVNLTAQPLLYFSIGMLFLGVRDILNRAFYAMQDTKTSMINGVIGVVVNIAINLILTPIMGIGGLALGTSASIATCSILLLKDLRKKTGGINGKKILESTFKVLVSSGIMSAVIMYFNNWFMKSYYFGKNTRGQIVELMVVSAIGFVVYFVMLKLLKVEELNYLAGIIYTKIKKKKSIEGGIE